MASGGGDEDHNNSADDGPDDELQQLNLLIDELGICGREIEKCIHEFSIPNFGYKEYFRVTNPYFCCATCRS